jgi:thiol-disulfide isomerase/thioredoxin
VTEQLQDKINSAKGNVIYLDFWASWCKPCRHSFPWMNDMKAKYQSKGLTIITVNLDKERVLAEKYLQKNHANFSVMYDPEGKTAKQLKLKGMPMSFTFDRSGKPFKSHVGFNKAKQVEYEQEIIYLLELPQAKMKEQSE